MTEIRVIGFKRVLARIERGKSKCAVLCSGCVRLSAGGLIAQDDSDAGEGRRMQIGEPAGERAGGRRLNLNGTERGRLSRVRLRADGSERAQAERPCGDPTVPIRCYPCHGPCRGRSGTRSTSCRWPALVAGPVLEQDRQVHWLHAGLHAMKGSKLAILGPAGCIGKYCASQVRGFQWRRARCGCEASPRLGARKPFRTGHSWRDLVVSTGYRLLRPRLLS
jgi:hypothetical protein